MMSCVFPRSQSPTTLPSESVSRPTASYLLTSVLSRRWSGITKEKLDTATFSLADIQKQLLQPGLIDYQTILLGHSLECDLGALKIRHPLCIDTALLYKHPRGAPFKSALKYLTKQWLGREIQNHGAGGHDSEEDARACMDLLKLKLQHGEPASRDEVSVDAEPRS